MMDRQIVHLVLSNLFSFLTVKLVMSIKPIPKITVHLKMKWITIICYVTFLTEQDCTLNSLASFIITG